MCPAIAESPPFTREYGGEAQPSSKVFTAPVKFGALALEDWRAIADSRIAEAREVRALLTASLCDPERELSGRALLELADRYPTLMPDFSSSAGQTLVARSIEASIAAADTGAIAIVCKRFGRDAGDASIHVAVFEQCLRLLRSARVRRFDQLRRAYRYDARDGRFAQAAIEGAVLAIARGQRDEALRVLAVCGHAEDEASLEVTARRLVEQYDGERNTAVAREIAQAFSIARTVDPLEQILWRLRGCWSGSSRLLQGAARPARKRFAAIAALLQELLTPMVDADLQQKAEIPLQHPLSIGAISNAMRDPSWAEVSRDDPRVREAAERGIAAAAEAGSTSEVGTYVMEFALSMRDEHVQRSARRYIVNALANDLTEERRGNRVSAFAEAFSMASELPQLALDAALLSYELLVEEDRWRSIFENATFVELGVTADRVRERVSVDAWCMRFEHAPEFTIAMMRGLELSEERFDEVEHALVLRAARDDRWFSAAFVIDSFAFDDARSRRCLRDFADPPDDLSTRERRAWAQEILVLLGADAVFDALLREAETCPQLAAELVVWFVENQDFAIDDGVYRFEHCAGPAAVAIRSVLALLARREPSLHAAVVERWSGRASELFAPFSR